MLFKCGIIGLPNVGKSTLFNLLTHSSVKAENFPFCTIKANIGLISILDVRLYQLAKLIKVRHIIPGNIELIDVAGLIKGASQGLGLGNSFLSDISKSDMLCHVVRCFEKSDIYHVHNEINPQKDIKIVHNELILSDINACERIIFSYNKNKKDYHCDNEYVSKVLELLKRCLVYLYDGIMLYHLTFTINEREIIKNYNFLTFKPYIYVANIDFKDNIDNYYLSKLLTIALNENVPCISICIEFENREFMKYKIHNHNTVSDIVFFERYVKHSNFFNIIQIIYQTLQLKTFFTINMKEIRAWIVCNKFVAIQAANIIHSDFKKYFIRVQVVQYYDFIVHKGWKESKKYGKMRIEGKNYLIQDGDILNFLI